MFNNNLKDKKGYMNSEERARVIEKLIYYGGQKIKTDEICSIILDLKRLDAIEKALKTIAMMTVDGIDLDRDSIILARTINIARQALGESNEKS